MLSFLKRISASILAVWLIQIPFAFVPSAASFTSSVTQQALHKGVFLLATDTLNGSIFHHSVILVVQHDENGTSGVILNKPTGYPVSAIFPDINRTGKSDVFFMGGPVMHKYVFSLLKTRRNLKNTSHVFEDVFFESFIRKDSSSIHDLRKGESLKLFAGYSGWGPGQLESEISQGAWVVKPAVQSDVFLEKPGTLWDDLMNGNSFLWAYRKNTSRTVHLL